MIISAINRKGRQNVSPIEKLLTIFMKIANPDAKENKSTS